MSQQSLIDALQTLAPLLGRLRVTAKQQEADISAALAAADRMAGILQPLPRPSVQHHDLDLCIVRASKTRGEVSFISGIDPTRLDALIGGAEPTEYELSILARLTGWTPAKS